MQDELETYTTEPSNRGEIRLNKNLERPDDVLEGLLGVERRMMPEQGAPLLDALVSEAYRLAAAEFGIGQTGWQVAHVMYLRNWVLSKVAGIFVGDEGTLEEVVSTTLLGGPRPGMVFMGDFIQLPQGYYVSAPARAIKINDDMSVLVSGVPTSAFRRQNLQIRITGLGRWVVGSDCQSLTSKNICCQTKESYLNYTCPISSPEDYLEYIMKSGLKGKWTMSPGSEMYLGPVSGRYDFFWGTSSGGVETAFGRVNVVRQRREFSGFDYFLRIDDPQGIHRIQIDRRQIKRVLLACDALGRNPRKAVLAIGKSNLEMELDFSPPAAETRWIYALGGTWLGSVGPRIKWTFPSVVRPQVEEMLKELWLRLDARGY
jgi:hypothetical protein